MLMSRERLKQRSCESLSTDATHWGGLARISVEAPVMSVERRGKIRQSSVYSTRTFRGGNKSTMTKPFEISKHLVMKAFKLVKANKGAAGVDGQSLTAFEENLKSNLYKIWNRLSSGSYFPDPVKAVPIPKKSGGTRILGVPTVSDRVAQMVVRLSIEPDLEKIFLEDSYGYRPNKSALQAVDITRKRCWKNDWVLEFDIKGLFDNIPHDLLMKAVRKHAHEKWMLICIERWLTAPMQDNDGNLIERSMGTPQGGVISPVLANLFLHYVFDAWMARQHPQLLWCRYADDGLVHCRTQKQAEKLLEQLARRFSECGLELHPDKTKIVYCKDSKRRQVYHQNSFDFLGYTFKPRVAKNSYDNSRFISFAPAVSKSAQKHMSDFIRSQRVHRKSDQSLEQLAEFWNPTLRGWRNYYGRFQPSQLRLIWNIFNRALVRWAMRKFKKLFRRKTRAMKFMIRMASENPRLFVHWNREPGRFA